MYRISVILVIVLLYISCQDKYRLGYISPATGSLQYEASGNCLPKNIAGTYITAKDLGDTNYMDVAVNVKTTGSYTIHTDTVNGISFTASGNFTATGTNWVRLAGKGKPLAAGTYNYTVMFVTSRCAVALTTLPVGGVPVPVAVFTLNGAPNACTNAVVSGSFAAGISLDTTYKLTVSVNVLTAGTYTINTNTVNGYSFSASGTFLNTGVQTVMLTGTGRPVSAGTDAFTVNGTPSGCSIPVTVVNPVAVTNTEYFPLSTGSYWNYDDLLSTGDTLARTINDSTRTGGYLYKTMNEQLKFGSPVLYQYRKTDSVYYEYISADKYTLSVKFSPQIMVDFPFLRLNLTTGQTWTSDEYIGTATFGQQIFLRYDFLCSNASATVTLNGKTFANVYKIVMSPKIKSATTYPYNSTTERVDIWYAKGVGVIYSRKINNGFSIYENQIRNWLVK